MHVCLCLPVYLCLSARLSDYLPACPSVFPTTCLCVSLSVCLFVYQYVSEKTNNCTRIFDLYGCILFNLCDIHFFLILSAFNQDRRNRKTQSHFYRGCWFNCLWSKWWVLSWESPARVTVALENSQHLATLPLVSRPNDVWETSAEIPYWWRVTAYPRRPRGGQSGREKRPWVPTLTDHFQKVKRMVAPDWAQKMLFIIVPNRRTVFPEFFSWVRTRRLLSRHSCLVRSPSFPNQKQRNYWWVEKRFGCYRQEQFNLHRENSVSDGSQSNVNNRKFEIQRRRESKKSNSLIRQNNFARASRFFVHLFAVTARLPHENT